MGEDTIKNIHYLVMKGIDKEFAGRYRLNNVVISGSKHVPLSYIQVTSEMEKMLAWYDDVKEKLHPIELAALFHFKFVYIHPFRDGNGRTARLLMNLILMQHGYSPAIVKEVIE
ncbi:Fic family protein [Paenibacillus lentus]|uniref:Fic family protein n=1 Tax=Paenibacillus lentus TaxID=1338368 RepID=UPI003648D93E